MNSTTTLQSSRPENNSRPIVRSRRNWLLVPMIATPLSIVASFYYFSSALQAHQTPAVVSQPTATQTPITPSSFELQFAQTQQDESHQKYQATLEQLQATRDQQAELQTLYQDTRDHLESLNNQNQQLQRFAAERTPLKAQIKQLQGSNGKLFNQVQDQKLQLTTLQNRLKSLENQKKQSELENQQLKFANIQLVTLKSQLVQAHRTIEQLSTQLANKPDEMRMININGKQLSVTKKLAEALKSDQQQLPIADNNPSTEQH